MWLSVVAGNLQPLFGGLPSSCSQACWMPLSCRSAAAQTPGGAQQKSSSAPIRSIVVSEFFLQSIQKLCIVIYCILHFQVTSTRNHPSGPETTNDIGGSFLLVFFNLSRLIALHKIEMWICLLKESKLLVGCSPLGILPR